MPARRRNDDADRVAIRVVEDNPYDNTITNCDIAQHICWFLPDLRDVLRFLRAFPRAVGDGQVTAESLLSRPRIWNQLVEVDCPSFVRWLRRRARIPVPFLPVADLALVPATAQPPARVALLNTLAGIFTRSPGTGLEIYRALFPAKVAGRRNPCPKLTPVEKSHLLVYCVRQGADLSLGSNPAPVPDIAPTLLLVELLQITTSVHDSALGDPNQPMMGAFGYLCWARRYEHAAALMCAMQYTGREVADLRPPILAQLYGHVPPKRRVWFFFKVARISHRAPDRASEFFSKASLVVPMAGAARDADPDAIWALVQHLTRPKCTAHYWVKEACWWSRTGPISDLAELVSRKYGKCAALHPTAQRHVWEGALVLIRNKLDDHGPALRRNYFKWFGLDPAELAERFTPEKVLGAILRGYHAGGEDSVQDAKWLLDALPASAYDAVRQSKRFWEQDVLSKPWAAADLVVRCKITKEEFCAPGGAVGGLALVRAAASRGYLRVIQRLAPRYDLGKTELYLKNWAPFRHACCSGNLETAQWLRRRGGMKLDEVIAQVRSVRNNRRGTTVETRIALSDWLAQLNREANELAEASEAAEAAQGASGASGASDASEAEAASGAAAAESAPGDPSDRTGDP